MFEPQPVRCQLSCWPWNAMNTRYEAWVAKHVFEIFVVVIQKEGLADRALSILWFDIDYIQCHLWRLHNYKSVSYQKTVRFGHQYTLHCILYHEEIWWIQLHAHIVIYQNNAEILHHRILHIFLFELTWSWAFQFLLCEWDKSPSSKVVRACTHGWSSILCEPGSKGIREPSHLSITLPCIVIYLELIQIWSTSHREYSLV